MVTYDEEMLQEINENVDLLEYVEQSIDLKPQGKDFFGHCPLHVDRTPSFSITPDKNTFYCFGCGRGGGIISYLISYEGMKYDQAVEKAATLASVDVKMMCKSQTVLYARRAKKLNQLKACEIKHEILPMKKILEYQKEPITEWVNEGISQDVMDLYEIRIDRKANRIVYPVYDMSGNLINIKGRTRFKNYKALGIAKYMNYYPIGTMDYFQGWKIAEPYVKETGELIIVESIKSVMKLYGYGIKNVVSAEKHNLSPDQIKWIISQDYIKNVVLGWDSDVSYSEAEVRRNINSLKKFVNIFVIEDSDGLLGGVEAKNSPIDKGIEIWNKIYEVRKKIT